MSARESPVDEAGGAPGPAHCLRYRPGRARRSLVEGDNGRHPQNAEILAAGEQLSSKSQVRLGLEALTLFERAFRVTQQ